MLMAMSLSFVACTEGKESENVNPSEKPEETPEEQTKEDIIVDAADFVGEYYGDAFTQKSGSYTLILADNGFLQGGGR